MNDTGIDNKVYFGKENILDFPELEEKRSQGMPATVAEKIFLDQIKVDRNPHLRISNQDLCYRCRQLSCITICPAGNYQRDEDGRVVVSYEGCLECGSCRIACEFDNIDWQYPRGGFGVIYRFG